MVLLGMLLSKEQKIKLRHSSILLGIVGNEEEGGCLNLKNRLWRFYD